MSNNYGLVWLYFHVRLAFWKNKKKKQNWKYNFRLPLLPPFGVDMVCASTRVIPEWRMGAFSFVINAINIRNMALNFFSFWETVFVCLLSKWEMPTNRTAIRNAYARTHSIERKKKRYHLIYFDGTCSWLCPCRCPCHILFREKSNA